MKTILLSIIVFIAILIFGSASVYAQEYITVKPAFVQDRSDTCSKSEDKSPPPFNYSNHASNDLNSNYTRTTMIDYNDTKLIVTINSNASKNDGRIYGGMMGYPPDIYYSNSTELTVQAIKEISVKSYEHKTVTFALTNVGNKTVSITHPFIDVLGTVINFENGRSVQKYPIDQLPISGPIPEWPTFTNNRLEPGQSIIQYFVLPYVDPLHDEATTPGNYTFTAFARFFGDINGTCQMVYLWSQPVDLTILPEEKIPEFPFAVPVFVISVTSLIILCRMKFR